MRHARRWAMALAGALFSFAPTAEAADGIKASATASRDVPVDIVVASFQLVERAPLAEGAADQQTILAKAIEEKGFKILERSTRYLPGTLGSYPAGQLNVVPGTGGAQDFVAVNKQVAFRVSGFNVSTTC